MNLQIQKKIESAQQHGGDACRDKRYTGPSFSWNKGNRRAHGKQRLMEKENSDLRESLEFAYKSIATLTERADTQRKTISKLTEDVNKLPQAAFVETERAIKLESQSIRNNLIFFNIPEVRQESSATTEFLLYTFLEQKLDMAAEETNEIPIERAHRLGKIGEDNKPRPIIAKFNFHKDKERILSSARTKAGTNYGISQDSLKYEKV